MVPPIRDAGPLEAVGEFLADEDIGFVVDQDCETLLMTWHPGGYLRRVA